MQIHYVKMVKKCKTTTYTSAIKLTEDTWKCGTTPQKKALLKALDLDESWAKTKSIREMVRRGGGLPANELLRLERAYLKSKGGEITINWK